VGGEQAGVELHRSLFPVGSRQAATLRRLGGTVPAGDAFLAWHRGIAYGLAGIAEQAGARGRLADWLSLRDEPVAADLLWSGDPEDHVTRRARLAFSAALADERDIGTAYGRVMAPDLRHRLGEHYTPRWLVERIADEVPRDAVTADPACGDGRFLVALLARGHDPNLLWGADVNPLAVVMARLNVWLAAGGPAERPLVRIAWADFLLDPDRAAPVPDWYVGNPPWVTWRNLSDGYRRAVAARMAGSRLHHARGWAARVSAGQADLAHLFIHEAVERVAPGGRLAFVLPRTTFKAPVGPGRLREGVATSGRPYRFREIWDCVDAEPFTGVRTDAVVGFVEADRPHSYPVRWTELSRHGKGRTVGAALSDPADPASPWLTGEPPLRLAAGGTRWTELRARGGVNTGGGNGAFHVDVVDTGANTATVRSRDAAVTAELETAYLRPLLRGRDVTAWCAVPSGHIVLPHDPADLRRPVPETVLAGAAPLTYAYLLQFKDLLAARKERQRWRAEVWYALFRIGPYTVDCWRVVWPHSAGTRLRAAVLAPEDRAVPDQKVVLVPFDAPEPALFLCALLNCPVVRRAAAASGGLDASPNLVRRLVLPRYDATEAGHRAIVALARRASGGEDEQARQRVSDLTARLFGSGLGGDAGRRRLPLYPRRSPPAGWR
jgi:adenine-specific DNA-methyltransferase